MKTIEETLLDKAQERANDIYPIPSMEGQDGRLNNSRRSAYVNGAHWMLYQLNSTIDQMRKSLMDAKLMLEHQQLEWTDTYKEIKSVLQNEPAENTDRILDGSLTGDDSRDVIVQQWLRLTEELFKKIK